MWINRHPRTPSSEITDERIYLRRREWLRMAGVAALSIATGPVLSACESSSADDGQMPLSGVKPNVVTTDEPRNTFEQITTYNNFYEFGTGKGDPARDRKSVV